jgi:polysaccharide export outer membrane protein
MTVIAYLPLLLMFCPPQRAGAETHDYRLGPDDQIMIRALDIEELDGKAERVDLQGNIDLPLIGKVRVAGLSVAQLEAELTNKLTRYVINPRVSVIVPEYRSRPISVLGAVNKPGVFTLTGGDTLVQVLSLAGGLRSDAGNTVTITRRNAVGPLPLASVRQEASGEFSVAEVSLRLLLQARDPKVNIPIEPHDIISVPRADMVYVVGAVRHPGGFMLNERPNITVLQVLSLAEGLEKSSAPKHATIIRGGSKADQRIEMPVNLSTILKGKSPDIALGANDILFIPESGSKKAAYRSIEAILQTASGYAILH